MPNPTTRRVKFRTVSIYPRHDAALSFLRGPMETENLSATIRLLIERAMRQEVGADWERRLPALMAERAALRADTVPEPEQVPA